MAIARIARSSLLAAAVLALLSGCVTVAEFRKLEREVVDMQRGAAPGGGQESRERVADIGARIVDLQNEVDRLNGRLEVAEHRAEEALAEARAARLDAAGAAPEGPPSGDEGSGPAASDASPGRPRSQGGDTADVQAYRVAYASRRSGDAGSCIDRFREFLQTYPASAYADDATYWMADCYFKNGDYKTAVLRFDGVVTGYPTGNKAADALYRQGEALLRLGHGKAAGRAFERVIKEYPDSARAPEAKKQLDLLGAG